VPKGVGNLLVADGASRRQDIHASAAQHDVLRRERPGAGWRRRFRCGARKRSISDIEAVQTELAVKAPASGDPDRDGTGLERGSGHSRLRWWVLALAAIAVSSSYYEDDVIVPSRIFCSGNGASPVAARHAERRDQHSNVALALINGLMIDRYGPREWRFGQRASACSRGAHGDRHSVRTHGAAASSSASVRVRFSSRWSRDWRSGFRAAASRSPRRSISASPASAPTQWILRRRGPTAVRGRVAAAPVAGTGITLAGLVAAMIFYWLDRQHGRGCDRPG